MQLNYKRLSIFLVFTCLLLGSSLTYVVLSQGTNIPTITSGPYAGAPSYTIYKEGSTYYAKNAYGNIDYSGTNASQIINSAFGALTVGRTWAEKVLLNGDFSITLKIIIPSYTSLEINGILRGTATLAARGASDCIILEIMGGSTRIDIEGGILDGGGFAVAGLLMNADASSTYVTLRNMIVGNCGAYAGILLSGVNILVIDCTVHNTEEVLAGSTANFFITSPFSNGITLIGCKANDGGTNVRGFFVEDRPKNVYFIGCTARNNDGNGFEATGNLAAPAYSIHVIDCFSEENAYGINFDWIYGGEIKGGLVLTNAGPGIRLANCKDIVISSNAKNNGQVYVNPELASGVTIEGSVNGTIISIGRYWDDQGASQTQYYGISGGNQNITIVSNDVTGNKVGGMQNIGTGSIVEHNMGYP